MHGLLKCKNEAPAPPQTPEDTRAILDKTEGSLPILINDNVVFLLFS